MKILTVDNETYDLDEIPETVDDLRYGILDYSNQQNIDYYFIPLVFLEMKEITLLLLSYNGAPLKPPVSFLFLYFKLG